jgi:hypothetical protein
MKHALAGATLILFTALAAPAAADITAESLARDICTTLGKETCTVDALKRLITVVDKSLHGKNLKSIAQLIGPTICDHIKDELRASALRPLLDGWQLKVQDRDRRQLASCKL